MFVQKKQKRAYAEPTAAERKIVGLSSGTSKLKLCKLFNSCDGAPNVSYRKLKHTAHFDADPLFVTERAAGFPEGSEIEYEQFDPSLVLQYILDQCDNLREHYATKLAEHPLPWHAVVGYDEFTPGAKLKIDNARKTMVLSFNLLELGPAVLNCDETWITCVALRTSTIHKFDAGWSQGLKHFCRRLLVGPASLLEGGAAFQHKGRALLVRASLSDLITDGDGHRQGLQWLGANAMRPCLVHGNVFKKNARLPDDGRFREITEHDPLTFSSHSSRDFHQNVDLVLAALQQVEEGSLADGALGELRTATGLQCSRHGLMADLELRGKLDVRGAIVIDLMHTLFQDGVMSCEMFEVINSLNMDTQRLAQQLRSWQFPLKQASKGKTVHKCFDDERRTKMERTRMIVGNSSELFALCSLLRYAVEVETRGAAATAAVTSFLSACKMVDVIQLCKAGFVSAAVAQQAFTQRASDFLRSHKEAYGTHRIRPKHHWLFDAALTAFKSGMCLDMYRFERLHLRAKEQAELARNTVCFERTVLAGILNSQVGALQSLDVEFCSLAARRVAFPSIPGATLADSLVVLGAHFHVDDVALRGESGDEAGCIVACLEHDGAYYLLVETFDFLASVTSMACSWRATSSRSVWLAVQCEPACAWRSEGDGSLTVMRF